jgi:hypothetical protein
MLYSERQIKFVKDTEKVPLIFGGLNILHKHTQLALLAYNTLITRVRAR